MQTIWEAQIVSSKVIVLIFLSVLLLFLSVMGFLRAKGTYVLIARTLCVIIFIFILDFDFVAIRTVVDEQQYAQAHQKKIEGMITDFVSESNGAESFSVNGVHFSYPISDSVMGYDLTVRDKDSVIRGNKQYVRLTYYTRDDVNVIIKIESEVNEKQNDQGEVARLGHF